MTEIYDKLICIDSTKAEKILTVGKVYTNLGKQRTLTGYQYHVLDDRGISNHFSDWRFKNVTEHRDKILSQLGI